MGEEGKIDGPRKGVFAMRGATAVLAFACFLVTSSASARTLVVSRYGGDFGDIQQAIDDGNLNITDPIFVLNWLFLGGASPPDPGPFECGTNPRDSEHDLGCDKRK